MKRHESRTESLGWPLIFQTSQANVRTNLKMNQLSSLSAFFPVSSSLILSSLYLPFSMFQHRRKQESAKPSVPFFTHSFIHSFIRVFKHSFNTPPYEGPITSPKASSPQSAIWCLLLQFPVSCPILKVTQ
jgi:hypothetical protein